MASRTGELDKIVSPCGHVWIDPRLHRALAGTGLDGSGQHASNTENQQPADDESPPHTGIILP
jgi:hypothetical protein